MKSYYQVLTTPTDDTPGTNIIVHFDDRRYLFGQVSEGSQRAVIERGVKLTNLSDIFLTGRTEWANLGGLIGTILTQADMRIKMDATVQESDAPPMPKLPLTIHGGRNLTHTLATGRRFIFRKGMPIYIKEHDSESLSRLDPPQSEDPFQSPTWSDENIKVWAMPLSPARGSAPQSPRKRSHDEFKEQAMPESTVDQYTRDQLMRNGVISDMFHSSWRADALVERKLPDVNMPAQIFVRNPETKDIEVYQGPAPGGKEPVPDITVLVRRPWPGAEIGNLPPTTRCDEALSYIVRSHDIRGRFDPKKALDLRVPQGPSFGLLTKGQAVVSTDGKTITPDMVLGPPRLGKGTAIIDLPTAAYVDNLINRPEWNSPSVTTGLSVFFWILGPGVGEHPGLREFVARYPQCKHVVSSKDYCPNYLALSTVAESSIRLARLKGDNYSVPVHDNVTLPQPGSTSAVTKDMVQNAPFVPAEPNLVINMEPNFGISHEDVSPRLNAAEKLARIPRAVTQRMTTIRKRMNKKPFQKKLADIRKDLPGADSEIIALGTGSSAPSKYRNVSSTVLHVPGYGYYLLDCGEATFGQLKRIYGHEKLRHVLQNLRMIWISHLHADHHLGTASVIKAWYQENYGTEASPDYLESDMSKILQEKRLFVVSDEMMIRWLQEYAAVEDFGLQKTVPLCATPAEDDEGSIRTTFTYRHCKGDGSYPGHETPGTEPETTTLDFSNNSPLSPLLRNATGLSDLLTTKVQHCRGALAVSFVFPSGFKASYSGDCRPSASFARIGLGSSVLIHEATFHDEMQGSAYAKKHSTTAEALEVARRMQARTILLTHFSQRYQKAALIDQNAGTSKSQPDFSGPAPLPLQDQQQNQEAHTQTQTADTDTDERPDLDIPDDTPPATESTDQIRVTDPAPLYKLNTPVAAAFDYMRIRVGDIPVAQAFEPVLIKLFSVLEREAAEEADKLKHELERKKAGTGKKAKKTGGSGSGKGAKEVQVERSSHPKERKVSLYSASESESGWETSEAEVEDEHEAKAQIGSGGF